MVIISVFSKSITQCFKVANNDDHEQNELHIFDLVHTHIDGHPSWDILSFQAVKLSLDGTFLIKKFSDIDMCNFVQFLFYFYCYEETQLSHFFS